MPEEEKEAKQIKRLIARIDPEIHKKLRHKLLDEGKSIQQWVEEAIKEKL
jgi:predicted HicB family RNase H-like nuclease